MGRSRDGPVWAVRRRRHQVLAGESSWRNLPRARTHPQWPKARTWALRGHTPVIPVSGKGSGRISVAGFVRVRPGHRTRLLFRIV